MTDQLELTVPHVTNIRLTFPGRTFRLQCDVRDATDVATVELAVAEVREGGLKPRVCDLCDSAWNEALEDTGGR